MLSAWAQRDGETLMSRYRPKVPPANLVWASSWKGKFIKDTLLDELGLVHEVIGEGGSVRLLARFPRERTSRTVALEAVADGEYIFPGDVRARYRPLDARARKRLAALRRRVAAVA